MSMTIGFELTSDLEFYCYLKAHLPDDYTIEAEPDRAYYSEWHYCYIVRHQECRVAEIRGDFRETETGALIAEAERILREARR